MSFHLSPPASSSSSGFVCMANVSPPDPSVENGDDAQAVQPPASLITQPRRFDILCGRGKLCTENDGNRLYRVVIESYRDSYAQALTKYDKSQVIRHGVYSYLKSISCRFLKLNRRQDAWEELSPEVAHDKIGHALRFANRVTKRRGVDVTQTILGAASSMCLQQIKQHAAKQPTAESASHSSALFPHVQPGTTVTFASSGNTPDTHNSMLALVRAQEGRMEARTYTATSSEGTAMQNVTFQSRLAVPTIAAIGGNYKADPKTLQNNHAVEAFPVFVGDRGPAGRFVGLLPNDTSHHQEAVPRATAWNNHCVAQAGNTDASDELLEVMMNDWMAASAYDTDLLGALDSNIHSLDIPRETSSNNGNWETFPDSFSFLKHNLHPEGKETLNNRRSFSGQQLLGSSIDGWLPSSFS